MQANMLRRRAQQGVAAVEFALMLIPMLLLAFGVVEYGRALYQYNTLVKTVRDGVRLLSQANPADESYPGKMAAAECLVVYGKTACTGDDIPLVPGLTTGHVRICDRIHYADCPAAVQSDYLNVATGMGLINLVEVRVSGYTFNFLGLPFVLDVDSVIFGDIRAVMRQVI